MIPGLGAVLLWGAVAGAGLWLAWTGLRPSVAPLAKSLARFGQPQLEQKKKEGGRTDLDALFAKQIRRIGFIESMLERQRTDLRIVGRAPDDQATMIGSYALLGLLLGPILMLPGFVFGTPLPPVLAGWISIGGAVFGGAQPIIDLRERAQKRRKSFSNALSAYCMFVDMSMASGLGVEQSLETAASSGEGWQFAEIRGTLASGRLRDITPWVALAQLGEEAGVTDLEELAGAVALAGEEGSAVRETVAGKARSIRERITADAERDAARVTVRMAIPASLMLLGFLVLLGYPAASAIFGGLD